MCNLKPFLTQNAKIVKLIDELDVFYNDFDNYKHYKSKPNL